MQLIQVGVSCRFHRTTPNI